MEHLEPALLWVAGIAAALVTIGGFFGKMSQPYKALLKRIEKLEHDGEERDKKLIHDHDSFQKQEEINVMTLKSLSVIMKHFADNNHTGELGKLAHEVDDLVYKRSGSL